MENTSPEYYNVIIHTFSWVTAVLDGYVKSGYDALSRYIQRPLAVAATISLMIFAWGIAYGWVQATVGQFVGWVVRVGFIYLFAMNWGYFSFYVIGIIQGGSEEIALHLLRAAPIEWPRGVSSLPKALQTVLNEYVKLGHWAWQGGGWGSLGHYFSAIVIWIMGLLVVGFAIFEILLAMIMMSVLFVTAPLFVSFAVFNSTRHFFDTWLGALCGHAFTFIFMYAIAALALSFAHWSVKDIYDGEATRMHLVSFIPIVIVGVLCIGLIRRSSDVGQSIGGTVTSSSGSSLLAGTVGGMIGGSATALRRGASMARGTGKVAYQTGKGAMKASNAAWGGAKAARNYFV